jgi:hypothetical protein
VSVRGRSRPGESGAGRRSGRGVSCEGHPDERLRQVLDLCQRHRQRDTTRPDHHGRLTRQTPVAVSGPRHLFVQPLTPTLSPNVDPPQGTRQSGRGEGARARTTRLLALHQMPRRRSEQ